MNIQDKSLQGNVFIGPATDTHYFPTFLALPSQLDWRLEKKFKILFHYFICQFGFNDIVKYYIL
jgi:hypothetical protein